MLEGAWTFYFPPTEAVPLISFVSSVASAFSASVYLPNSVWSTELSREPWRLQVRSGMRGAPSRSSSSSSECGVGGNWRLATQYTRST